MSFVEVPFNERFFMPFFNANGVEMRKFRYEGDEYVLPLPTLQMLKKKLGDYFRDHTKKVEFKIKVDNSSQANTQIIPNPIISDFENLKVTVFHDDAPPANSTQNVEIPSSTLNTAYSAPNPHEILPNYVINVKYNEGVDIKGSDSWRPGSRAEGRRSRDRSRSPRRSDRSRSRSPHRHYHRSRSWSPNRHHSHRDSRSRSPQRSSRKRSRSPSPLLRSPKFGFYGYRRTYGVKENDMKRGDTSRLRRTVFCKPVAKFFRDDDEIRAFFDRRARIVVCQIRRSHSGPLAMVEFEEEAAAEEMNLLEALVDEDTGEVIADRICWALPPRF